MGEFVGLSWGLVGRMSLLRWVPGEFGGVMGGTVVLTPWIAELVHRVLQKTGSEKFLDPVVLSSPPHCPQMLFLIMTRTGRMWSSLW